MQTTKTKKMSLLWALAAITAFVSPLAINQNYYQAVIENDLIRSIKNKLAAYSTHLSEERIYLQLDKPLYEPGNDIWFSLYLRDGENLKPSTKSDIVHVELINPKGTVEKTLDLIARNGKASGDFNLEGEAVGGLYKIKAYTNWMKNEGEDNCFLKDIQVQEVILPNLKMKLDFERKAFGAGDEVIAKLELSTNENKPLAEHKLKFVASLKGEKFLEETGTTDADGLTYIKFRLPKKINSTDGLLNIMIDHNGNTESISRSIPIVLNTLKFTMYPEGGDLVCGVESKVAFKALNEFGKPADVEGIVENEKGQQVATFSSFHQGMGAFKFKPTRGEHYVARITKPEGIQETFKVGDALDRGYVLNIDNNKQGEIAATINSTEEEEMAVIAQVRGKLYYSTSVNVKPGQNTFTFSTQAFPMGVSQITLFDSKGIARAERLAFVNKHKQMNISVSTDKEKYLPRERVKMTLSVKDERGLPMPANLSMAVVNDQLLSFADDRSGNILSLLLLQQDIKEKIEEPAFYFSKTESKADKALDLLLMTSGWRRFTWEKLVEEELPSLRFTAEKTLVSGTVLDANTGKSIANVKIRTQKGEEFKTDEQGKFAISKLELYEPVNLTFEADGYGSQVQQVNDYRQGLQIYLYNGYTKYERMHLRNMQGVPQAGAVMDEAVVLEKNMEAMDVVAVKAIKVKHIEKGAGNKPEKKNAPEVEAEPAKLAEVEVEDKRAGFFEQKRRAGAPVNAKGHKYYRARQFVSPTYEKQEPVETRTDFRNTIYWNPNIEIGYSGKKTIEFYASDDITSFRTTVEGIGTDGSVGRCEKNFYTQLPFVLSAKVPVQLINEDIVSIPLTLVNNTNGPLGGVLTIKSPAGLQELVKTPSVQTIMPGKAKTIYLDYKVQGNSGDGEFSIGFKCCGLSDAFTQKIKIEPKGFPVQASFSAQEIEKEYSFEINDLVHGSLKASFTAFPNVVSDLVKGVEGILQEPYGCFEQTSCTAYPNAMVLDYLKTTDSRDNKTLARATELLDRGYKRLTTFETSTKGYEWFGANPAHEGLTAYGIMEFVDMQKAGQEIDKIMLDRTARWLLNHKDGRGGFEREKRALHDFGRISDDILNGYIVYALAEAGYTDIKREFNASYAKAMESKDPYLLALMSNAAASLGETHKAGEALKTLITQQAKDGSFTGSSHSITYSQGSSLTIETTALTIMAILKSNNKDQAVLNKAVNFLVGTRSGSGVFSSTQGTILALKSLTEFAKFSKRTTEDGMIAIYVDGKKVAEKNYSAGDKGAITVEGLEQYVKGDGKHSVKVKYIGVKSPLPYSMSINWNTSLPNSDKQCDIDLKTKLATNVAAVGETVRLTTTIINKKDVEVPSTMAIIGIPAGFSAQAWQLKELQEKQVFDHYEIKGNNLALYYRGLGPKAIKEISLDLKAEIPGDYDAPASSAYLYYTNEFKTWNTFGKITVKK